MLLRVLLWILVAYFAYRFIFNFVLPVWKVSRRMRSQMREFQQRAQQPPVDQPPPSKKPQTAPNDKAGDYIDFEEVKG
jgi:hypothetical protein